MGDFFAEGNARVDVLPDWIIVQRSAIPYSYVMPGVLMVLESDYQLVHAIRAANLFAPGNVYDVQDDFYTPYGGFKGVRRPGRNLEICQRC